jgi:hypothetical protein
MVFVFLGVHPSDSFITRILAGGGHLIVAICYIFI